jgi:glycosyltransferase involved in cell wall biosynthesis
VVVPTYYRNDELREALRSVARQSYEPVEIIVVDDSGERHAATALEEVADVTYVALAQNRGANGARNAGADVASGEYVHFLDDDDRLREDALARQVAVAREHPDAGVVYTGVETTAGRVSLPDETVRGDVLEDALAFDMWPCMTSTMLIARDALAEVRPFSDRPAANDIEFMIELATVTRFEFVDEPLVLKRVDRDSLGHSLRAVEGRKAILEEYAQLYENAPGRVRDAALAETYLTEAEFTILEGGVSVTALAALSRHVYHTPGSKAVAAALFVAGCLGRPGWRAVRYVGGAL